MNMDTMIANLLDAGLDDWIQAAEVASIAKTTGPAVSEEEVREFSTALVRRVLQDGSVRIGDLLVDEGFVEWDLSVGEAVRRVEAEWAALGRTPSLGELFWLENTEEGNRLARGQAQ